MTRTIIRQEYGDDHLTHSKPRYKVLRADKEPNRDDTWHVDDVVIGEAVFPPHTVIKPSVHFGEIAMHVVQNAIQYEFDRTLLSASEEGELIIEEQIFERKQQRKF